MFTVLLENKLNLLESSVSVFMAHGASDQGKAVVIALLQRSWDWADGARICREGEQ